MLKCTLLLFLRLVALFMLLPIVLLTTVFSVVRLPPPSSNLCSLLVLTARLQLLAQWAALLLPMQSDGKSQLSRVRPVLVGFVVCMAVATLGVLLFITQDDDEGAQDQAAVAGAAVLAGVAACLCIGFLITGESPAG